MNFNEIKRDFTRYKATYVLSLLTTLVWLWQFFSFGAQSTSSTLGHFLVRRFSKIQARYGAFLPPFLYTLVGHIS